jgi:hypothetical protein
MVARPEFLPFANDAAAMEIDGLKFENGTEVVSVYGSVSFTRDAAGRERLARVLAVLEGVRTVLDAPDLPASIEVDETPPTVTNPFD